VVLFNFACGGEGKEGVDEEEGGGGGRGYARDFERNDAPAGVIKKVVVGVVPGGSIVIVKTLRGPVICDDH